MRVDWVGVNGVCFATERRHVVSITGGVRAAKTDAVYGAERDLAVTVETLQHYILNWLTLAQPVPEGSRESAQALGRRRMDCFSSQVPRCLQAQVSPSVR